MEPKPNKPYGTVKLSEEPDKFSRFESSRGFFRTVSSAPTYVPISPDEQIVYYKNGATLRIYIFDVTNNVWSYATLT
jgi:hypothetical protein